MGLRDLQQRHAREIYGNANGVAESITYRFSDGSPERTFNAAVRRDFDGPDGEINRRSCVVAMPRHATTGVESVVVGKDRIVLPVRIGEAAVPCCVVRVVGEDQARIIVEVLE
ncbi:MAG: hypothetical protein ACE37K_11210 [Planctomycetota bacterium]